MSLLSAIAIGLYFGWAVGGTPKNLMRLQFRWSALIFVSIGLQLWLFTGLTITEWVVILIYPLSLLLALIWLGRNWRVAGVPVALLGGLSNFIAIIANGGLMPIQPALLAKIRSPEYVRQLAAGQVTSNSTLANSHTHLRWLTDIIFIPPPWPSPTVLSVGDLLIAAGVAWLIAAGMRTPQARSVEIVAAA
jgi:hypothetical protein